MENKRTTEFNTASGVNYDGLDPFKIQCQKAALLTAKNAIHWGVESEDWSRGESAFVFTVMGTTMTMVIEGLGTKNLVAEEMFRLTGKSYYKHIAQDTAAMIINDILSLQSVPAVMALHFAAGDDTWFKTNKHLADDFIEGWKNACDEAGCVWGPGETPGLKNIIYPNTVELSGSCIGIGAKKPHIEDGDAIILLQSSGIHANGLTGARKIADELPDGYLTLLPDGRTYGETLLDPTHIYAKVIDAIRDEDLTINYAINITGHGYRKLMRLKDPFTYHIHTLLPSPPIFDFIQKHKKLNDEDMYASYNMGAGFALIVPEHHAERIVELINNKGYAYKALNAGVVHKGEKQVVIDPKNFAYKGETLGVR